MSIYIYRDPNISALDVWKLTAKRSYSSGQHPPRVGSHYPSDSVTCAIYHATPYLDVWATSLTPILTLTVVNVQTVTMFYGLVWFRGIPTYCYIFASLRHFYCMTTGALKHDGFFHYSWSMLYLFLLHYRFPYPGKMSPFRLHVTFKTPEYHFTVDI